MPTPLYPRDPASPDQAPHPSDDDVAVQPTASPPLLPRLLSYADVANLTGRSRRTVRLWVAKGLLRVVRIGGAVLIPDTEILRLLAGADTADYLKQYQRIIAINATVLQSI